jgi:hypothetical protein
VTEGRYTYIVYFRKTIEGKNRRENVRQNTRGKVDGRGEPQKRLTIKSDEKRCKSARNKIANKD